MLKGIVFDLDHTLFDRYKTFETISYPLYEKLREQLTVSRAEFYRVMCDADKRYNHYGWAAMDAYAESLSVFKAPYTKGAFTKAVTDEFSFYAEPFPFVRDLLITLRLRYKVALITNGPSERQRSKLRLLGLDDKFDFIYISGEHGFEKPDLTPFYRTAEALGVAPQELVYVGDHPVFDVDASRRAGYTPVWVKTIPDWQFDALKRADFEIDTVAELPEILEKLD